MKATARILVVDDSALLRQVALRVLTEAGHTVVAAGSGQEALALARSFAPDVVLIDVVLPDMSGIDVCRQLRTDSTLSHIGLLLISGQKTASEHRTGGLAAGADGYITRPIPNTELVARVEALFRLQQLTSQLRRERDLVNQVMETSPVAIAVVDRDGVITYSNPRAKELLGSARRVITESDLSQIPWRVTDTSGSPVPIDQLIHQQVLATGGLVTDLRHVLTWPDSDGRRIVVSLSGAPIVNEAGVVESTVITIEDVTQQEASMEHIAYLNRTLNAIRAINQMLVRESHRQKLIRQVCDVLVQSHVAESCWGVLYAAAGDPDAVAVTGAPLDVGALRDCLGDASQVGPRLQRLDFIAADCGLAGPSPADRTWVVALVYQGQTYGLLGLTWPEEQEQYQTETAALVEELAADIASAIHSLEQEAELQARTAQERAQRERLQRLVRVGNELALATTVDDLCRRAIELGTQSLGFERLSIWLPSDDGSETMRGTWGTDERGQLHDERGRRIPLDRRDLLAWNTRGAGQQILRSNVPLDRGDGSLTDVGTRMRALMWDADEFVGLLSTDNLLSGCPMTTNDEDLLGLYASFVGNAIVRKRASEALQERERFYRTLFETTGAATMVLGRDMRPLVVNQEAEAMFGYTVDELKQMRVAEYVDTADRDLVEQRHRARRSDPDGTPGHYEVRMRTKSGRLRNVMVDVSMIPGTDQSIASFSDVTPQRRAMDQMRQRAAQQSALNTIISQASVATDLGRLLETVVASTMAPLQVDAGGAWLGDVSFAVGIDCADVRCHCDSLPDDTDAARAIRLSDWRDVTEAPEGAPLTAGLGSVLLSQGLRASMCVPLVHSGTRRRIGCLLFASRNPRSWSSAQTQLLEAIGRQLSTTAERLHLLDQVRREVDRLQTVIDAVPEGVVLLNPEHRIELANPVAAQHLQILSQAGPGDRIESVGGLPVAELLTPPIRGTHHEVSAQGRIFEILAQPLAHTDNLEGWLIVGRDVTDDRLVEQHQRQQEQLAAVGRLASGIAHDFNNIIAIIVLYAQMATRQLGLSSNTRDQLHVISEQARRATDLIEQILDFSRSAPLTRQPMDLLPYVKEIVKLWQRTLPENIVFEVTYEPGDYTIVADPTRIQQTLMNLATNARDAMPEGGSVCIAMDTIDVESGDPAWPRLSAGGWVRLSFTDSGTGIAPEVLPYVFEPFFTTKTTGSGLGLAQVHGIVKQHDGEVEIESEVGAGTTITLYLPAAERAADLERGALVESSPEAGRGETILVVEDNPHTREALLAALDGLNYHTLAATNGRQALEVLSLQADHIDLILSDAIMPELGARGLLAALAEQGCPHPVLVLSGYVQPEEQDELRGSPNFVGWLTKPVDLTDLATAIKLAIACP